MKHVARRRRSLSGPIILSSVSVALSITMLVGWIFVLIRNRELAKGVVFNNWMMVGGVVSLGTIITVLVLFTVFLGREVREVRRQDSFIDSVTHELRSPLAAIRLCLETLGRADLPANKQQELKSMMLDDVSRLDTLIDSVLLASRVGEGKGLSQVERVRSQEWLERSIARVTQRAHVDPGVVTVDSQHAYVLKGDPSVLEIILDNVLDNAIKYSGASPRIQISVFESSAGLHVHVRDHGIGISRRDQKRIFERFYRVPEESVRARPGTGLGLFIVAAMVRNLGGRIRAVSEGPNQGTCVQVTFPRRMLVDTNAARDLNLG